MERVIITGATGMIGLSLVRKCIAQNIRVVAVVRPNSKRIDRLPSSALLEVVECDISDFSHLQEKISGSADVFFHFSWGHTGLAKFDDVRYQIENIDFTIQAVRAAKAMGCKAFIGAGSQAEYGVLEKQNIAPECPCNPKLAYGICKYAAGKLAMLEGDKLAIAVAWVRIFSVYGPWDKPTTMIASTIDKMLRAETVAFTKGEQFWDYLYCDDAADAFFRLGNRPEEAKGIFCLGSGKAQPLVNYIQDIAHATAYGKPLNIGAIPYPANQLMFLCADITRLEQTCGFSPQTQFVDGITKTVEHMKRIVDSKETKEGHGPISSH